MQGPRNQVFWRFHSISNSRSLFRTVYTPRSSPVSRQTGGKLLVDKQDFKVLVPILVTIILLQTITPSLAAESTYIPGVQPGQWATYGQISASWYPPNNSTYPDPPLIGDLQSVDRTTLAVINVQGAYVIFNRYRSYGNDTSPVSDSLWGDVQTGEGNLTRWLVAGNLTTGDETYLGSGENFSSTISRTYLGVARSVNPLNITQTYQYPVGNTTGTARSKLNAFYDQTSGMLLELHFVFDLTFQGADIAYGSANTVIVDSDIFGATPTPDFYLYLSPVPIVTAPGAKGTTHVFPISQNGFTGTVNLSADFLGSSQVVTTVTPSSILVASSGSGNATLTISVASSVPSGYYSVNVTGTSGSISHSVLVPVQIIGSTVGPGFSIYAYPAYLTIPQSSKVSSLLAISSVNFTGSVTLFAESSLAGISATPQPGSVTLNPGGTEYSTLSISATSSTNLGLYTLNITGFASTGHSSTTITVQVTNTSNGSYEPGVHPGDIVNYNVTTYWLTNLSAISKPAYLDNYGNKTAAQLAVLSVVGTTVTANLTWTFTNNTGSRVDSLSGDVNSGVGTLDLWIIAGGLHAGDPLFNSLAAPRINTTIIKAYAGSFHNVNLLNITRTVLVTSQGITVPVNAQVSWYWDATTGLLLEQYQSFDATYGPFSAKGSIDILATRTNIVTTGSDFAISADPSSTSLQTGESASSTLKLTSVNNFSGTVGLSLNNAFCAAIGCPHPSLAPASVNLASNGTATSSLTFTATTPGTYDITVNATSMGITRTVTVEFKVNALPPPDFSLTGTVSLSIKVGKTDSITLNISPGTGFTSQVSLTVTAPNGITVQLSQSSLTGQGIIHMTVTASNDLSPGTYTVTITAKGGSQTHTKAITVTVTSIPSGSQSSGLILGLDPMLVYSLIGAIAAITIAVAILTFRLRKSRTP